MEPTASVSAHGPRAPTRPSQTASAAESSDAPGGSDSGPPLTREYTRLLGLQEHLRTQLERIQSELESPAARALIEEVRARSDSQLPEGLRRVREAVASAVEGLSASERELRAVLETDPGDMAIAGVTNLPVRLARFIAERRDLPGFHYDVLQDDVRGWIIVWKEYNTDGSIRGSGRFYERPYAWLDD